MTRPACPSSGADRPASPRWLALAGIALLAAWLRLSGLGTRSLWLDEFSTWHVSRLPLAASLWWPPELSIPPLYQLLLRLLTDAARPEEWLLRLPAAIAGVLAVAAMYWLGRKLFHDTVALAAALLLAVMPPQVVLAQEARPYTLLLLGAIVSTGLWHQVIVGPGRGRAAATYVLVTAFAFSAHLLMVFTVAAHIAWWLLLFAGSESRRSGWKLPVVCTLGVLAGCVPHAWRLLAAESSAVELISWIEPISLTGLLEMLARMTLGWIWLGLLAAALAAMFVLRMRKQRGTSIPEGWARSSQGMSLLICWLAFAWLGLGVASVMAIPLGVPRYAVAGAGPAILLPLAVSNALHRNVFALIVLFGLLLAATQLPRQLAPEPGFRELVSWLDNNVEPGEDAVISVIGNDDPVWVDLRRLEWRYYSPTTFTVEEVVLKRGQPAESRIWRDPRRLFLVVFRSDPFPLLSQAGRTIEPFQEADQSYSQLLFTPYRLVRVSPLPHATGAAELRGSK